MMVGTTFAQTGTIIAIFMKTKDAKIKELSIPAMISSTFGVSEPAIYGISLPLKKPFILSCIAAAAGGAVVGITEAVCYLFGGIGVFEILSYIHPEKGIGVSFWGALASMVVCFVLGFLLTYFFGIDSKSKNNNDPVANDTNETTLPAHESCNSSNIQYVSTAEGRIIPSPLTGEIIPLNQVNDEAFSSEALGKGIAILPSEGKLLSPITGTVTIISRTKHAIGITGDDGIEMLVHIGLDTVKLRGKYFTPHVVDGQRVEQGQLLTEFNIEAIQAEGYEIVTPIIVTNKAHFENVQPIKEGRASIGDAIIALTTTK